MQHAYEALHNVSAEPFPGLDFVRQTLAVAEADMRKLIHDPVELFTRMVQPALWLLIFGQVFTRDARDSHRRHSLYRLHDARHPGAERAVRGHLLRHFAHLGARSGNRAQIPGEPRHAHRAWCSDGPFPPPLAAFARWFWFTCWPFCCGCICTLSLDFGGHRGSCAAVMLGAAVFSTFSLIAACIVKSRDRFMGIGQVLTMPLFFASNAIYPLSMMPSLAARLFPRESAYVPGGCLAAVDGGGRHHDLWLAGRFPRPDDRLCAAGGDCHALLSEDHHLSRCAALRAGRLRESILSIPACSHGFQA